MKDMRVQLSLIFRDAEVYDNLIIPYKQQRSALTELIIKLLSSYYYKPDVRALIDAETEETQSINDFQSCLEDMRNNLAMQSFLADEMLSSATASVEDMGEILKQASTKYEQAKATPVEPAKLADLSAHREEATKANQEAANKSELAVIAELLKTVLVQQGNTEGVAKLDAITHGQFVAAPEAEPKTERQIPQNETSVSEPNPVVISNPTEQTVVTDSDEDDASDTEMTEEEVESSMNTFLGSIGL